jgi:Tol biopolymer transport system component
MKSLFQTISTLFVLALALRATVQADVPPDQVITDVAVYGGLSFSPDGNWLVLSGQNSADTATVTTFLDTKTWKANTPPELKAFEVPCNDAKSVAWTPDSKHVIVGLSGNNWMGGFMVVSAFDFKLDKVWECAHKLQTQTFDRVCAPAGGNYFAGISSLADRFRVYDYETGKTIFSVPTPNKDQCALALSPDGNLIALADRDVLYMIDVRSKSVVKKATLEGAVDAIAFGPDSSRIGVVFDDANNIYSRGANTQWLVNLRTDSLSKIQKPSIVPSGSSNLLDICYSHGGKVIFLLYDQSTNNHLATSLPGHSFVLVRDCDTLSPVDRLGPVSDSASSMAISPDGVSLVVSETKQLSIWSVKKFDTGRDQSQQSVRNSPE